MKLTVTDCTCGNPMPHKRFADENGKGLGIESFFSLVQGRYVLKLFAAEGKMTDAEVTLADAELVASGLPEFPPNTESDLRNLAARIASASTKVGRDQLIANYVREGEISPAEAELVRGMIRDCFVDTAIEKVSDARKATALWMIVQKMFARYQHIHPGEPMDRKIAALFDTAQQVRRLETNAAFMEAVKNL
jgi:hypothetical protein